MKGHYDGVLVMDADGNTTETDGEWLELGDNGKAVLFLMDEPYEMTYEFYTDTDFYLTTADGNDVFGQYEEDWIYLAIEDLVLMLVKENTPEWEEYHKNAETSQTDAGDEEQTDISAGDADYDAVYSPVLTELADVINDGYDFDREYAYLPMGITERVMYDEKDVLKKDIGYLIQDISGDGIPELLIGETKRDEAEEWNDRIVYGCYTYSDGKIVTAFAGMTRSSHRYSGDGYFTYVGSNGAMSTLIGKCHISSDGTELVWDDFYFTEGNDDGTLGFYHNTTGMYDVNAADKEDMTDDDFSKLMDSYHNEAVWLPFTPIGDIGCKNKYPTDKTALEGGLGEEVSVIALPDGEMEGTWHEPALGGEIKLYEYRGEFEFAGSMGESSSGDIVYNGDPDTPKYTLRSGDGTDIAQIYFFTTTNGYTCMKAEFDGDYSAVYIKQIG